MSARPGPWSFTIYQGASFLRVLTCTDDEDALIDWTGFEARMQVRKSVGSDDVLLDLTEHIVLGGAAGTITISLSNTETDALTFAQAVYDLELESADEVIRLLQGQVRVSAQVSR